MYKRQGFEVFALLSGVVDGVEDFGDFLGAIRLFVDDGLVEFGEVSKGLAAGFEVFLFDGLFPVDNGDYGVGALIDFGYDAGVAGAHGSEGQDGFASFPFHFLSGFVDIRVVFFDLLFSDLETFIVQAVGELIDEAFMIFGEVFKGFGFLFAIGVTGGEDEGENGDEGGEGFHSRSFAARSQVATRDLANKVFSRNRGR